MNASGLRTELHLNPGRIVFAGEGQRIHTLLGSCVALTVWHRESGQGGMCHAVLPERVGHSSHEPGCFVDEAIEALLRAASLRVPLARLEYKLFGGGRMLGDDCTNDVSVGVRNVQQMRRRLASFGVAPTAEHCGGRGWRKLVFDLADGRVQLCHTVPGGGSTEWWG